MMVKILIIEDEQLVARMFQKALDYDGFEVKMAIGGEEGLEKVKKLKPDIVLCDIMMPEPDGMEVLEKIKSDSETKDVPVVMLTNLSGKHDAELALSRGAADYWVKKDADVRELGTKLKKIISEGKSSEVVE